RGRADREGARRLLRRLQRERQGRWKVAGRAPRLRWKCRRVPAVVVQRDRGQRIPEDGGRVSRGRQEAQGQGQADRAGARPQLRRPASLRLRVPLGFRGRRSRRERQEGRDQLEGHARVREVPAGLLEGRLRRGRARLGRHEQQSGLPRGRDRRDPQRRLDLHRRQAPEGQEQGRQGPATAKATEAYTKYVIVDMYAKAVQGMKAEDAVKWAEGEMRKIYEA